MKPEQHHALAVLSDKLKRLAATAAVLDVGICAALEHALPPKGDIGPMLALLDQAHREARQAMIDVEATKC